MSVFRRFSSCAQRVQPCLVNQSLTRLRSLAGTFGALTCDVAGRGCLIGSDNIFLFRGPFFYRCHYYSVGSDVP